MRPLLHSVKSFSSTYSRLTEVDDELREWAPHGVWLSLGDRGWVQVDQTVHGSDDVEGFRASILLLRVCVSAVLDLAIDLLVPVELTGEYEHSPVITADNTLTLLKKETGIG